MPDAYRISAPGRENGLELGLRVPEGDTVSIGNISYARSETTFTVLNLAVNTTPFTIDGVTYGAGRGITFDLQVSTAISSRTAHIDFSYTTASGIQRTDRLHLLIYDAVAVEASSEIAGASVLGQTGLADNLLAVVGTSAVDTNLGDLGGATIAPNSSIRNALIAIESKADLVDGIDAALADLLADVARHNAKEQIDPRDFGVVTGTSVTEQQALDNADAILAAALAAWDKHYYLPTPGLGGSLNRRIMPPLNFAGLHIQIAKPLQIAWQAGTLTWLGHGATISRYGAEGGFEADYPGRWGIEIGEDYNLNTCPMFIYWTGFTFTGFARCLQLGFAPNNINMGFWYFDQCHFVGPSTGHPKTFGVRAFNRSASLTFNKCMWNEFTRGLEVQSVDQFIMRDCRIQIGNDMWSSDITRPDGEAQIVVRHARVTCDNMICNPPLRVASTKLYGELKDWSANEVLVKGAYRDISGTAYRTKNAYICKATIGAEDVSGSSPDWETIPDEAAGFANIDMQRYYWIKVQDFPAWQANTEYVKGDIVLQPYDTGGDPLYWSRLAYTASSGASWLADRNNWQPIDSMRNWQASQAVKQHDVRLATQAVANGGDGRSKFWVSNTNRTTGATFDAAEVANWTVVTNSDSLVSAITGSGASPRRSAGQPISAWHTLDIIGQTLFGAESGGLTPLYWDVPKMPLYTANAEPRKQHTSFRIIGCGTQTDRRYPFWPQNPTNDIRNGAVLRPVVLMAQIPNYGVIKDNILSKTNFAVAAMFDPYLAQPDVPLNNIANWPSHWDFIVEGNQQGSAGITAFPSSHTPFTETYRHYGPNWAPEVLLEPVLDILMGTGSPLASVTAWANGVTVRLGEHRKATDPADSIEKLWRSRFTRTTGASFDATEKQYWQLVADQTESAGTFHSPMLSPSRDTYRLDNPIAITINSFARATPGKAFTVICLSNKHTFQHVAGRMRLKGGTTPVVPTYGQSLTFVEMMGELWEIARNF